MDELILALRERRRRNVVPSLGLLRYFAHCVALTSHLMIGHRAGEY